MYNGASDYANSVDTVMLIIVGISIVLLIGITVAMLYFVFRYNRKRNPVATQIHGNILLEVIWIVVPTILVIIMFWYGYEGFRELRAKTDYANQVDVTAFMWGWEFNYDNGKKSDTLVVPVGEVTKLKLFSRDVNHSFYIPSFRIKEDVIGSDTSYIIIEPKETGTFDIACAEYCGLNHWNMYAKLHVMEDSAYRNWLKMDMASTEEESGEDTETVEPATETDENPDEGKTENMEETQGE
jgi:cytochrome c oxidase subunit 2